MTNGANLAAGSGQVSIFADTTSTRLATQFGTIGSGTKIVAVWPCATASGNGSLLYGATPAAGGYLVETCQPGNTSGNAFLKESSTGAPAWVGASGSGSKVQTTSVTAGTSGNVASWDGSGNTQDSGLNASFSGTAPWVPQTVGVYNATGLSGNASSNLLTSAPAGQYVVNIYVNQTTGCTTPSPGKVALNLSFTDSSGAQTKNPATLMFTSGATTTGASLVYSFWQATSGTIQASTTYTACMTGTATYDVHYTLTRVQ